MVGMYMCMNLTVGKTTRSVSEWNYMEHDFHQVYGAGKVKTKKRQVAGIPELIVVERWLDRKIFSRLEKLGTPRGKNDTKKFVPILSILHFFGRSTTDSEYSQPEIKTGPLCAGTELKARAYHL